MCSYTPAFSKFSAQSFDLHSELARALDGAEKYGYRRGQSWTACFNMGNQSSPKKGFPWLSDAEISRVSCIGSADQTAQIHPKLFTELLVELSGAKVVIATAIGLQLLNHKIVGLQVTNSTGAFEVIPASTIMFACGAWTEQLLSGMQVSIPKSILPHLAHSLVLNAPSYDISADMIFGEVKTKSGLASLEFYPRPDDTLYICGSGAEESDHELVNPKDVKVCDNQIETLTRLIESASPHMLEKYSIKTKQACILPFSRDGLPFMGRLANGLFACTGHGCWGILLAPLSGLVMAEMIIYGKAQSFDLESL